MKTKYVIVTAVVSLLIAALMLKYVFFDANPVKGEYADVFIGVDAAYDSIDEIKTLVDAVSPYTNFFVIGSKGITFNETKLDDLCQYIYDKQLSFIVYTDDHYGQLPSRQWIGSAKARWGDRFLGLYIFDEVGGKQLDRWNWTAVHEADNYTDASKQFVNNVNGWVQDVVENVTVMDQLEIFTSDYALYWFDYKAIYDVVFAEFGWNYSRQLNVALNRGAAVAQNKDWGVVITWTYDEPPYLESGEQLYDDMVLAYDNGAKYILIFDTNKNYTHGVLGEEHFQALKQFTEYAHKNPRTENVAIERVAFVLPEDFAYGFRGPTDRIWGLWEADAFSYELSVKFGELLKQYGNRLDVIYDDSAFPVNVKTYDKTIFWNGTTVG
jgi:hypothetical protein